MKSYRWGIIAPGNIARSFATALNASDNALCYGVASREPQRAAAFAKEFGFEKYYGNYQELLNDPQIDIVYIGSPHSLHFDQSVACLSAGKAVLCEKPMTVNVEQARKVIEVAQANRCFYMEAVWTRFMPLYSGIRKWLNEERIGEVKMVQASFGLQLDLDPQHRLYNPQLAGGGLLDLGIYPITLSQWVFGEHPKKVRALGHIGETGVDEQLAIALSYEGGGVSHLGCCITANTPHDAWIIGCQGRIHIHPEFWSSQSASLYLDRQDGTVETLECPHQVNGYEWEIAAVHQSLEAGELQNSQMNWATSLSVMRTMDEIRWQIGLRYPFE